MRKQIFAVTTILLFASVFVLVQDDCRASTASNTVPLQGNTLPIVANGRAHLMGHHVQPYVAPSQKLRFLVGLALKNQTGLDTFLEAVYDPRSPSYHHYLTPEQFGGLYSPTSDQYNAVSSWLSSNGFVIEATYPNRLIIEVSGSVAKVEDTFNIQINTYNYSGQVFFANVIDPQVPAQFNGVINSIIGLDNFLTLRPYKTRNALSGGDPTYTPQQILKAYNIQPVIDAGYKGTGQAIAIATAFNYSTSDVRTFESQFGLPQNSLVNIPVGGSSVPYDKKESVETTLDIEWSSAIAQGATIRTYMGVDARLATFTAIYDSIVTDNAASVMSTSWGLAEPSMPSGVVSQDHSLFEQAAAQGIAIFAASGDSGAYDAGGHTLAVDFPASDPYVTAVGGTSLSLTSSDSYSTEIAWSSSGGGVSSYFPKPSWQSGIPALSGYSWRGVPDVAYDADPSTGVYFYYNGGLSSVGGTSIGAPQWAGIAAIWNQYLGGSGRLGWANPILYNSGIVDQTRFFHDVVTGNNGHYSASTGWDLTTGWGSPNVYNLFVLQEIVFSSTRDGGIYKIFSMSVDGSIVTQLTFNTVDDEWPAWSPDGRKIAFARSVSGSFDIFTMNFDGSDVTQVTSDPVTDSYPAWSPDGSTIAFYSTRNGDPEIYLMNADGTNQRRLTFNAKLNDRPTWSPDGTKIAFSSYRNGYEEIFVIRADGTGETQLTFNTEDSYPAWSPDGSKIAFTRPLTTTNYEIFIMNPDGSSQTQLTSNTAPDMLPAWSSDGGKIAFQSNRDGNPEVYLMNVDGLNQVGVTNNPAVDTEPAWEITADIPPIAYIDSISPNPTTSGNAVSFSGHGTDSDGSVVAYSWRSSIDGQLSTSASFSTSILSVGTHTIYFKVQDNSGAWSTEATATLTISLNAPPSLSSGYVDPSSGTTSTTFGYSVTYSDAEGAAPTVKRVWIDGSSHDMTLYSGSASSGTYRYQTTLSTGSHNYYFEFSDGTNTVKLPTSGSYSGPTISSTSTITFQANGVGTDSSGTVITIDSVGYSYSQLPQSYTWTVGSTHTIAASSPVNTGPEKQYAWTSWSDGGGQTHTYTTPSSSQTVTVSYKTQYYLTVNSNPSGVDSPRTSGWYDSGSVTTVTCDTPVSSGSGTQYVFTGWSGDAGGSNPSTSVTMSGPKTATANYKTQYYLTMQTSGSGSVSPSSGWLDSSSAVQIQATPTSPYTWGSWTGTGSGSYTGTNNPASITMNGPITETANFQAPPAQLTISIVSPPSPPNGGSLSSSPVSLKIEVTANSNRMQGASVLFYVDSSQVDGSQTSDPNGYASVSFSPSQSGHSYSWYATASKPSYASGTSPTWSFTYSPNQGPIVVPSSTLANNSLGRVFLIFNNKKYYVTNPDAFTSYGFNWADVKTSPNPDSYQSSQIYYDYLMDGKMPLPNKPYIAGDVNDGSLYYIPYYSWTGEKYPINGAGYNAYAGALKKLPIRYGDPAMSLTASLTVLDGVNPIPSISLPSHVIGKNPLGRVYFIFNGQKYYFTDWPAYTGYGFKDTDINPSVNPDSYPNAQVSFDYLLEDLTSVLRKPLPNQPYIVGDVNDGSLYWIPYYTWTGEKYPITGAGYNDYSGQLKTMYTRYGDPSINLRTSSYVLDGTNPILTVTGQ